MKPNFTQHLKDFRGKVILNGDGSPIDFKDIACQAILAQKQDEKREPKEIHQRQKLAEKTWESSEDTEFTESEMHMITQGVKIHFTTLIAGPILKILQPTEYAQA